MVARRAQAEGIKAIDPGSRTSISKKILANMSREENRAVPLWQRLSYAVYLRVTIIVSYHASTHAAWFYILSIYVCECNLQFIMHVCR